MTITPTKLRERPINLRDWEVRAILSGAKTQLRRPIVPQPDSYAGQSGQQFEYPGWHGSLGAESFAKYCRLGQPGDLLWGRETFLQSLSSTCDPSGEYESYWTRRLIEYAADGAKERFIDPGAYHSPWMKKRPSSQMPRWASRITLEITEVRVQRLQEISEEDAWKEGFPDPAGANREYPDRARYWFRHIWDSTPRKRPGCNWASNPWVNAITFRRAEG